MKTVMLPDSLVMHEDESSVTGAPIAEIEITKDMCAVARDAAQEFYYGNSEYALTDECLSKMFLSMISVYRCYLLR